jgi:hypothetical protein
MSYQPYPSGGSYQPYPAGASQPGQRPPQPTTIRNAVWLMYGGAALSALSAIYILIRSASIKRAINKALVKANATAVRQGKKPLTLTQIHSFENAIVIVLVVILLIGVGLWVWMAWANSRGSGWARIVASVLFGLNTIYLVLSVSRAGVSVIFIGLSWLLGLGAIILLWQRLSSDYIRSGRRT